MTRQPKAANTHSFAPSPCLHAGTYPCIEMCIPSSYLKNPGVFGSSGAGKSIVGGLAVLCALSQGLNVVSTALMALRAPAIGGTHLHELFKLPRSDNATIAPYEAANVALEKIRRKTDLLHGLLTVDMIFLDEAG